MSGAAPWLAVAASLVVLYILFRVIVSPLFWTLAVVAIVVLGFAMGWHPEVLLLLAAALAIRWFVGGLRAGRPPTELTRARDPWGRPYNDPYFYKGPPGPRTNYR